MKVIQSNIKTIQLFLDSTDANWRNSIYIECQNCKRDCPVTKDFLYTPGPAGLPLIVPVSDMEVLFGRTLDKSECLSDFSVQRFCDLYNGWFTSLGMAGEGCPMWQAVKALYAPEEW